MTTELTKVQSIIGTLGFTIGNIRIGYAPDVKPIKGTKKENTIQLKEMLIQSYLVLYSQCPVYYFF